MQLIRLAACSLLNRRLTAALVVLAIALSVTLLLGVERLRHEARHSFSNTLSGTDLIVGARSGPISLLLHSVFRIGQASNSLSWDSYQQLQGNPAIAWAVPLTLGDSHRGFAVIGTTGGYFSHYHYGQRQPLRFAAGRPFQAPLEVVLGAKVASKLGYSLSQPLVLAHGTGSVSFVQHNALPFRVVGILAATGTPVDHSLHVPLAGLEAVHRPGSSPATLAELDLTPKAITAVLLGLHQRGATFAVQRQINDFTAEPLQAIIPGLALQQMWDLLASGEQALRAISVLVVVVGLTVLMVALTASLQQRRREMAILRALGAGPQHVLALVVGEALLLALAGIGAGLLLLGAGLQFAARLAASEFGLSISRQPLTLNECWLLIAVLLAALIAALLPAWRAYRYAVADGLMIRV